jgi:hypothetical protein
MAKFPLHPRNPERICRGCEKFCPEDDMYCGNGTIRAPHPCELMGDDWYEWLEEHERPQVDEAELIQLAPPPPAENQPAINLK